jgi:hypothetical protein
MLIYSSPDLKEENYTLWAGDKQLAAQIGGMTGGMKPQGMNPPSDFDSEMPKFDGEEPPQKTDGETPKFDGTTPPDFQNGENPPERPQGERPEIPEGQRPDFQKDDKGQFGEQTAGELSTEFKIVKGGNMFSGIALAK